MYIHLVAEVYLAHTGILRIPPGAARWRDMSQVKHPCLAAKLPVCSCKRPCRLLVAHRPEKLESVAVVWLPRYVTYLLKHRSWEVG